MPRMSNLFHVAEAMRMGQHQAVDSMIKEIECTYNISKVQEFLTGIQNLQPADNLTLVNEVYVHFIALKLLRFFLERDRDQWVASGELMLSFLLQYGMSICQVRNAQASLAPASSSNSYGIIPVKPHISWRPVFQELSMAIALVLKFRCVAQANGLIDASFSLFISIDYVVKGLVNILEEAKRSVAESSASTAAESGMVLACFITQRTIEEFGLFDFYSRRRSVSMKEHILCRKGMEAEGLVPLITYLANNLLVRLSCETLDILGALVSTLKSALSWFKYRYIDTEEEIPEEEVADVYEVKWDQWGLLLLGHINSMDGGNSSASPTSLADVLFNRLEVLQTSLEANNTEYSIQNLSVQPLSLNSLGESLGSFRSRQQFSEVIITLVQCIRCLCSYSLVGAAKETEFNFIFQRFRLCIRMLMQCLVSISNSSSLLLFVSETGVEEKVLLYEHMLPVIINGIRRLAVNFTTQLLSTPFFFELFTELGQCISSLWNIPLGAMQFDTYWGSLDDLLSCWLTLMTGLERACSDDMVPSREALACASSQIFESFVRSVASPPLLPPVPIIFGEGEGCEHIRTLENNCFQLMGHIGRLCPEKSCTFLQCALSALRENLDQLSKGRVQANWIDFIVEHHQVTHFSVWKKAICMMCHIIGNFLGDPSEGEHPCIPNCFLPLQVAQSHVVPLIMCIMELYSPVICHSPVCQQCDEGYNAYIAALEQYMRVYVDAEETNEVYTQSFQQGLDLAKFCVVVCSDYWNRFPTGESSYVSQLFSTVVNKRDAFRQEMINFPPFKSLMELVKTERVALESQSRGKLAASIASCLSPKDVFVCIPEFLVILSNNTCIDDVVYSANCLIGMAQFLCTPAVLRSQFSSFYSITLSIVQEAFNTKGDPRQCTMRALELLRLFFTTFSPAVGDSSLKLMLKLLPFSLENCIVSLRSCASWYDSNEGLHDRHELLHSVCTLLYEIALWKSFDCSVEDEDVAVLEAACMNSLVFLCENLSSEERKIPALDNALCTALEHCSSAFTTSFIQHPQSSYFMDTILYTIRHENPSIQAIGIRVISTLEDYFTRRAGDLNTGGENGENVFSIFFDMLLHAIVHHRTTYKNRKQLSAVLLKIAQKVSMERISALFQQVLNEHSTYFTTLQQLYEGIRWIALHMSGERNSSAAQAYFEEVVVKSLTSLDSFSISSN